MNPTITPSPIPINNMPPEFAGHMINLFKGIFNALKQIEIPFTSVNCYQVLIGTLIFYGVYKGWKLIFGINSDGGSTKHE